MNKEIFKKIRHIDLHLRRKVNHIFSGQYRSAFKGQGLIFSDFKEYVPGDDIRSLSWNLLAKTGRPYVKTFEEERESHIVLLVDVSASMEFGTGKKSKQEVFQLVSALLAFCAEKNQDPVGLLLFAKGVECYLPPKKGKQHIFQILQKLCEAKGERTDLSAATSFLQSVLKKRSHIFLVSDFLFSKPWESSLKQLARRHDLVNVMIFDSLEKQFPPLGLVDVEDLETGNVVTVSSSFLFRKHYKKQMSARLQNLKKKLVSMGSEVLFVDSSKDIYDPFLKFFNKRTSRVSSR